MLKRGLAVVSFLTALSTASPALAYWSSGTDPDDRASDGPGFDQDIRSTSRGIWTDKQGRRWLTIRFRAYERLGDFWVVNAHIDSRLGPGTDYRIQLVSVRAAGEVGCSLRRPSPVPGIFVQEGNQARCRLRAFLFHPTKRIRWRLVARESFPSMLLPELAPNRWGWYN